MGSATDAYTQGSGPPPGQGKKSKKKPLGPKEGYTVTTPYSTGPADSGEGGIAYGPVEGSGVAGGGITHGIQYYDGDQWGTAQGFPTDTDGITTLQYMLLQAGLLKPNSGVVPGQWDQKSADAFAQILKSANQSGTDWSTTLNTRITAIAKGQALDAQAERHHNPLVIRLTNPADIAKTANDVGKALHGTYMDPAQLADFTAQFQKSEQDYQTQAYNATGYNPATGQQDTSGIAPDPGAPGADTVTQPASAEAQADKFIRENNSTQFKANTFTDRLNEILAGLVGGPGQTAASAGQVGPL